MNFIKKHKFYVTIAGIILILFIVFIVILYKMFFSFGEDERDLPGVKISNYTEEKLESELAELEYVTAVKYELNKKSALINIFFYVEKDLEKDTAKEYGDKVLEYFSDEEKENYDIQLYMIYDMGKEDPYTLMGYKKKLKEGFSWSNN